MTNWVLTLGQLILCHYLLIVFPLSKRLNPITFNLGNGSKVKDIYIRTVKIEHEILVLRNVLFIPKFAYNLIFGSKLVMILKMLLLIMFVLFKTRK